MNNMNPIFSNFGNQGQFGTTDHRETILAINNLLISMLADKEIPTMIKPQIWGEVRKDTLTKSQFDMLLASPTDVGHWLRASFPEMVKVTFINNDRINTDEREPKIAVYFELKDGFMIIHPVGFTLPGGSIFKCGERADVEECRKLTDRFVFFGPDARYASCVSEEALQALQKLKVGLWEFMDNTCEPLNLAIRAYHDEINSRIAYQAKASVLAPVLSLVLAAMNDPDKKRDMGRWLRSEYLHDKEVFNHACHLLDLEIDTEGGGVTVRYL